MKEDSKWNIGEFFLALEAPERETKARIAEQVIDWTMKHNAKLAAGEKKGETYTGYSAYFDQNNLSYRLFKLSVKGRITVYLSEYREWPAFKTRTSFRELSSHLALGGFKVPEEPTDGKPSVNLVALDLGKFSQTFEWVIARIKES